MRLWLTPAILALILLAAAFTCGCTGGEENSALSSSEESADSLLVYCGAGMREPMDEIATLFEEKEGISIDYTYGGSAQLLSQIELYQKGDAYMPGAQSYIQSAIDKGFVDRTVPVVYHVLAIATPKGNPANITCIADLANEGVRVAIGEPTGPAVGKAAKKMLDKDGLWDAVDANTVVKSGTVNELLVDISMDQVDAAIIWEDLYNPESMDLVPITLEEGFVKVVPIGTLTFSEYPADAEKFMNFVASDESLVIFEKHGFATYPDPEYENL